MKVVILAAGDGTRVNRITKGLPKPLLKFCGVTLIERIIENYRKCGFNEFLIVIGYKGDLIKKHLEAATKELGLVLTFIENNNWQDKENGYSLLVTEKYLLSEDKFLVVMADHIFFSLSFMNKLKEVENNNNNNILCCDFKTDKRDNLSEATKVKIEKNKIIELGKNINEYDAIDCGVFLFSSDIFTALKSVEDRIKSETTLTAVANILAKEGKLTYLDIGDTKWWDIDNDRDYLTAQKEYMNSVLIKEGDGIISRVINRRISKIITKSLLNTNITPNQVSVFSFLLALLASMFIGLGFLPLGGILTQLASIIDGCDGEIARLKNKETNFGAFFDSILDRYADYFIIAALIYTAYPIYSIYAIIIGMIALCGSPLSMLQTEKFKALTGKNISPVKYSIVAGRDVRLFIVFIGCLFSAPFHTLIVLGIITHLTTILRLFSVRKIIDNIK